LNWWNSVAQNAIDQNEYNLKYPFKNIFNFSSSLNILLYLYTQAHYERRKRREAFLKEKMRLSPLEWLKKKGHETILNSTFFAICAPNYNEFMVFVYVRCDTDVNDVFFHCRSYNADNRWKNDSYKTKKKRIVAVILLPK
jgi:hypothetical protein